MRTGICTAAVIGMLGLAVPVGAQTAPRLIGSVNGQSVVNQPIDTSRVVTPAPAFQLPTQRTSFNLIDLLRQVRLPTFPALFGESPLPPPGSFPTYPDFQMVPKQPNTDFKPIPFNQTPDFKPIPFKSVAPYEPRYVPTNNRRGKRDR